MEHQGEVKKRWGMISSHAKAAVGQMQQLKNKELKDALEERKKKEVMHALDKHIIKCSYSSVTK